MPSFSGNNTLGWGAGGGAAKVDASGGTTSEVGVYKVHTFSGNGTLTVNTGGMVQVMIVGGGGGCTDHSGCGGGGGAVIVTTDYEIGAGTYPITVGGGGSAGGAPPSYGTDGGASTMLGATANGGGNGRGNAPLSYGKSGSTSLGSTINSVATGYGPFNAGNPSVGDGTPDHAGGGGAAEEGSNYGWVTGPSGPRSGHHINGGQGGDGTAQANWHSTYSHFGGGGGGHSGWQGSRPPAANGGGGLGGKGHYCPSLGGCQAGTSGTPLQGGGGGSGAGGQCQNHSPNCCGKSGGSGGVFVRYLK